MVNIQEAYSMAGKRTKRRKEPYIYRNRSLKDWFKRPQDFDDLLRD